MGPESEKKDADADEKLNKDLPEKEKTRHGQEPQTRPFGVLGDEETTVSNRMLRCVCNWGLISKKKVDFIQKIMFDPIPLIYPIFDTR